MELIKEIYEKDIDYDCLNTDNVFTIRKASRSIVYNDLGEIAILYVSKHNYHKLPGGGIEVGEDIKLALNREVMEEVGVNIDVLGEVGLTIEYRVKHKLLQISYCYYSRVKGDVHKPSYTDEEIDNGFVLKWVNIEKAILMLENDLPDDYVGKFINKRDLLLLKKGFEIITK
jgi:8-oxo-dGTP diphosphatase